MRETRQTPFRNGRPQLRGLDRTALVGAAPEGGAAFVAIQRLVEDGSIKPSESVVLFNTGGALKYLEVIAKG